MSHYPYGEHIKSASLRFIMRKRNWGYTLGLKDPVNQGVIIDFKLTAFNTRAAGDASVQLHL